ncbi:DUF397 domain-containing protein [Streptomyces sp. NPDC004610]|uniref:DUF397 domain-containing protein n=1 Tax=unclassified Streptomyces TaxID=2593676 RepID=UPI0033B962D2
MNTSELAWFKSSYSTASGDDCIEVATGPDAIHVRDSKTQDGPYLALSPDTWGSFITHVGH